MKLRCIKYRTRWAWGYGSWQHAFLRHGKDIGVRLKDAIEDFADGIHDNHSYSDKYRGIEYKVIRKVPEKVVIDRISSNLRSAKYSLLYAAELAELIGGSDV